MPFANEDLFLALCSGRDTMNGHLASPDQWSFTLQGKVWVDQSWLSHLAYYVAFLNFEYLGPVLIKGLLLAACVVLLYMRCRSLRVGPNVSMIAVTLGVLALAPFLKIRGENFGMFLFVIMTGILTSSAAWGRWRQVGALLVLALWSNCHGSFMLGFLLIGLRLFAGILPFLTRSGSLGSAGSAESSRMENRDADGSPSNATDPGVKRDLWAWTGALVLAVPVMAFANPYGWENLVIPFNQLTEKTVIAEWIDWRPLFHWRTLFTRGFFKPVSVLPFLIMVGIAVLLFVVLTAMSGIRGSVSRLLYRPTRSNVLMELLLPVLLAPLVFRFQRMILFAAPAMIPVLAILMQSCTEAWKERTPGHDGTPKSLAQGALSAACAGILLLTVGVLFYKSIVMRHVSGNPLTYLAEDPPILSRLMSRNFMRSDAAGFLKRNHATGRVFTNVFLSNYFLFHVPDIQVYFDLRVQSVYPKEIVKGYLSAVTPRSGGITDTLQLLDRFGISLVILDTSKSTNSWLADQLMQSASWGCIYADEWVIILANAASPRFGPMISSRNLDGLTYDRPETKTLSLALLSLFTQGMIQPELLDKLIAMVKDRPRPEVYSLIMGAMNGPSPCLNPKTKRFLESEALRLSRKDYRVSGGAFSVLQSLLRILVILERNEIACVPGGSPQRFRQARRRFTAIFRDVKKLYGGL
jgi:hypothetical protein